MKGIICEQVQHFKMIEMEEPLLQEGQCIIEIKRIGICGTDLHAYNGNQPFFSYPRMLGHELSGVIVRVGENVEGLQAGVAGSIVPYLQCGGCIACRQGKTNCCTSLQVLGVHTDGGMRERIAIPTTHFIRTPELSLEQSAVLEPFSIGAHAVRRSRVQTGETVLVIGAGPIGLGVMAFAKRLGCKVIAMDINEERLAFCQSWAKVDDTVNALQDPEKALLGITNGDYPTVVFDATGNAKSMMSSFQYVAHGGTLVYVGLVKGDICFHDPHFHKREITLMASRNATREDFDTVIAAIKAGVIDVSRYVTHRVPFDEMIAHFESWLKPENQVIKAMVEL
jgi:2-desacetyl-2-hydroxyethyl bacteriochlorophyllide A dehydrogenase